MTTTVIRNAGWVIAWDEAAGRHIYRRNIDIAFSEARSTLSDGIIPAWQSG